MECWCIHLTMKADAPIMRTYREGRLNQTDPPTESVPLIEQEFDRNGNPTGKWKALDIEQYGPAGIVALMEEADLWSGRGRDDSLIEMVNKVIEKNERNRKAIRERQRNFIRDRAAAARRQVLGIPLIQAGIDLLAGKKAGKPGAAKVAPQQGR